tara:strand:+ start:1615 stop:2187 length:573 start_codon:yes stop_codon:yes gene_type:complete
MGEVKELKKLDENLKRAIGEVGAEAKYADALEADLKKIETDEPDQAIKDVKKGIRLVNFLGRTNRYADRYEKRLVDNLVALAEILPDDLKQEALKLAHKIELADAKITKEASRYVGDIREELNTISTYEHLVKRYKDNPDKAEQVKSKLTALIQAVEKAVADLSRWIKMAQVILARETQHLDDELHQLSA